MPSGFKVGSTDLDDLFKPRGSSAAGSNTGFLVGTQDLADRYRQSTGTHDRIAGATGFTVLVGGADLRERFRSLAYAFDITGPSPVSVNEGGNLSMSVAASGGVAPYSYQWQYENPSTHVWSNLVGQTGATLSINPCSRTDAGNYQCVVTDSTSDTATSFPAAANVNYAPSITGVSSGGSASSGSSLYLWITAEGGMPPSVTYQWKRNGVAIDGSTDGGGKFTGYNTSELTFNCDYRDHNASFTCTVTNTAGLSATSSAIIWSVTYAPQITAHPGTWEGCSGSSASLSCSATGNPSPSYQWQKWNGSSWDNVGTGSTFTIGSPSPSDSGTYRCVVSNSEGSATSSSGTITIYAAPSITSGPSGLNVAAGTGPYALQCAATGDGTLYFEWQKWNGSSWQTYQSPRPGNLSATSDQHVWNPIASGDAGDYRCRVTSEWGCTPATSGTATVVVT